MPKRIRGMIVVLHNMRALRRELEDEGRHDEAVKLDDILASWDRLMTSVEKGRRHQVRGVTIPMAPYKPRSKAA